MMWIRWMMTFRAEPQHSPTIRSRQRMTMPLTRPLALLLVLAVPTLAWPADTPALLLKIQAVGKEGQGNVEAAKALKELVQLGPVVLLDTLQALDKADATATNWLRGAVETITDQALTTGRSLPADKLEGFVKDTRHSSTGRRLAYECLVR